MTEDKARKNDVRHRMDHSGERYNVARRAVENVTPAESHLIGDEETRRIAESFLATSSSWLKSVNWQKIVAGHDAASAAGWAETLGPKKTAPGEGQRWSWAVTFTDPSGQQKALSHEIVLQGIRALVFGENRPGADNLCRLQCHLVK